jgi:hypothetical protein
MLYGPIPCISYTCCYFQFPISWLHPSLPYDRIHRHSSRPACFANVASVTFIANTVDAPCRLLPISFRPGFHEWTPKSAFSFEDRPDVVWIPNTFDFSETPFTYGIYRTYGLFLFFSDICYPWNYKLSPWKLWDNLWAEGYVSGY